MWSEAGRLRRVMVCSPGLAHLRLTPDTCDELLFDDVLWVSQAKRDHYDFVTKMRDRDVEVLEMLDLLADVVAEPEGRQWVLDRRITDDLSVRAWCPTSGDWLESLPADKLAEHLIGGVSYADIPADAGGAFLRAFRDDDEPALRAAAAAEHPVHPGQLVVDLPGRHAEPDVLAGAAPGDAAHRGDLPLPPGVRGTRRSRSGSATRSSLRSTAAPPRSRAAT